MKVQLVNRIDIVKNNNFMLKPPQPKTSFKGNEEGKDRKEQVLALFLDYEAAIEKDALNRKRLKKELAYKNFEEAERLFYDGENKKALDAFSASYAVLGPTLERPDKFYGKFNELGGDIFQINGKLKEANTMYQNALVKALSDKNPNNPSALHIMHKLAENYSLQGNVNEANDILDKTAEMAQSPNEVVKNVILRLLFNPENAENTLALSDYAKTVSRVNSLNEDFEPPLLSALAYHSRGEYDKSNSEVEHAMTVLTSKNKAGTNDFLTSLILLGTNHYALHKLEGSKDSLNESISNYDKALDLSSKNDEPNAKNLVLCNLGQIYFEQNDFENAQKYLTQVARNARLEVLQRTFSMLGEISLEEKKYGQALNYFEAESRVLKTKDFDNGTVAKNLEHLVTISRLANEPIKAQRYDDELNILNTQGRPTSKNTFEDLMYLGTYNLGIGNNNMAQEFFQKAVGTKGISAENSAAALIYLGSAKIVNDDLHFGLADMENGCKKLQGFVSAGKKFDDKHNTDLLFKAYSKLGETYYFSKSDYKSAAVNFEKALMLAEEKDLLTKMSDEDRYKLYSRVAAAFYKAQNYSKSATYCGKYLKALTDDKFNYSVLDNCFVDNVINNNKGKKCIKIATALEMLGVANVKNRQFQAAISCFETSFNIRTAVQGRKIEAANDLRALSRIMLVNKKKNGASGKSKMYMERAVDIMKAELGAAHPETVRENKFLHDFYGKNLASAMKYVYANAQGAKSQIGQFLNLDVSNNWKREIIDDFHLIYKDLKICE